jgi:hypothetical protein
MGTKLGFEAYRGMQDDPVTLVVAAAVIVFLAGYGISVWKSPGRRK